MKFYKSGFAIKAAVIMAISVAHANEPIMQPDSVAGTASTTYLAERLFTHDRSFVDSGGRMLVSADYAPAYKQLRGLLPREWELVFATDRFAIAPIAWSVGDSWVDVLNEFGKLNHRS